MPEYQATRPDALAGLLRTGTRRFAPLSLETRGIRRVMGERHWGSIPVRGHAELSEEVHGSACGGFEELVATLLKHVNGILNYCRIKVRFGVVERSTAISV